MVTKGTRARKAWTKRKQDQKRRAVELEAQGHDEGRESSAQAGHDAVDVGERSGPPSKSLTLRDSSSRPSHHDDQFTSYTARASAHDSYPTPRYPRSSDSLHTSSGDSGSADMAPAPPTLDDHVGPHPSFIEIAKPYIFEQRLQEYMTAIGMNEAREDAVRLQGVAWIDNVRRSMQLPVRTFNTAVVYYHKFRLLHADTEYNYVDAAAAALFTACKIEDTLKKSKEILCAASNLKLSPSEHLSSDDPVFETHSKAIIGLERLMLEGASFDFRNRHPQKLVAKLAKGYGFPKKTVGKTAYTICLDLYRTFAPLKQGTSTMAIACVELAARLHEADLSSFVGERGIKYKKWGTTRAEVMETLLDLLDLYTHHRPATTIGLLYPLETFINTRITLNQESTASDIPRFTEWTNSPKRSPIATNGFKVRNGIAPTSPITPITPGTTSPGQGPTSAIGIRGQNGTVRFMLDAARAREEKRTVESFYKVEQEEYEVEVPASPERRRLR